MRVEVDSDVEKSYLCDDVSTSVDDVIRWCDVDRDAWCDVVGYLEGGNEKKVVVNISKIATNVGVMNI